MPRTGAKRVEPQQKIAAGFVGANVRFTGDVVNLSESGVLLRGPQTLALQTTGRFGIVMDHETIRSVASVRRQVPGVGIAFQFIQMNPRDRELLHRLLYRLQKDRPA